MDNIHVSLGVNSYNIYVESGLIDRVGSILLETLGKVKAAVVTDDNVAPLYLPRVTDSLRKAGISSESIVLPHGEKTKTLPYLEKLYTFLAEKRFTRSDAVVSLGGGVIGDLAGLAAATYLRGISFVQIPTSLLAQVDSSVGGKVAVDLPQGKNLVGAFHQPKLVICDPDVLATLSDKFWRDGMGEVAKYGCIGDKYLFELLERNTDGSRQQLMNNIGTILQRSIQQKVDVVQNDEHDTGMRMILNFGHTVGHAVESCQNYSGLSHGEAVSVGMIAMTKITEKAGITRAGTCTRIENLLEKIGLPTNMPAISEKSLIEAMSHDKKMLSGKLNVVVLDEIGKCHVEKVSSEFFESSLFL